MTDRYRISIDPMYCAAAFVGTTLLVIGVLAIAPVHFWEAFAIAVAFLWLFSCPMWWYRYEETSFEEDVVDRP